MVEGGGLAIPAHGLAVHVMLVVVLPGRPRASMRVLSVMVVATTDRKAPVSAPGISSPTRRCTI